MKLNETERFVLLPPHVTTDSTPTRPGPTNSPHRVFPKKLSITVNN